MKQQANTQSAQHTPGPTARVHTPKGMGRAITSQRVALFDNLDQLEVARANFTPRDRKVRAELEASEMLREFIVEEM